MLEIEAEALHQLHPKLPLRLDREGTRERQRRRPLRLALQRALDEARQHQGELVKQPVDRRFAAARLVFVEQRLIAAFAKTLGLGRCGFADERQQRLQRRQHQGEVAGRAGLRARRISQAEQAFDKASTRSAGTAVACTVSRRISARLARCQGSSAGSASAAASRSASAGSARSSWQTSRKVASCSARAAAPPAGIIGRGSHCSTPSPSCSAPSRGSGASSALIGQEGHDALSFGAALADAEHRDEPRWAPRRGVPGDGVLQMVVGEVDLGLPAHGQPARDSASARHRCRRAARSPAAPRARHGRNVDIEPVVLRRAVVGQEPVRLALGRQAQQAGRR